MGNQLVDIDKWLPIVDDGVDCIQCLLLLSGERLQGRDGCQRSIFVGHGHCTCETWSSGSISIPGTRRPGDLQGTVSDATCGRHGRVGLARLSGFDLPNVSHQESCVPVHVCAPCVQLQFCS
jgi:hypothetical protein